jgi:predicted HD superfamily hydrolase involved in NAD metabolism
VSAVPFETAAAEIDARLSKKAARHCHRVAESAVSLALVYGVDTDAARLAGVLHDWDREEEPGALLEWARADGVEVAEADVASPHLLHARTGAIHAKEALPALPDEVARAISRHTLGAPDMSPLDMVVYLADMIESHRDYPGVEALRASVGKVGLRELFALGYRQSMRHLIEARKRIHPVTVDVWNTLVAGESR